MKKIFKRKSSVVPEKADLDVAGLMNEIQKHLISLEEKIDTLISRSSERYSERRPPRSFGRPFRHGKGKREDSSRERSFTQAICAECGKECEIPFKPSSDRPVYCRECFAKRKGGREFR